PRHLAVLTYHGFVRAAPALPGVSRVELPSASSPYCDRVNGGVFHLRSISKRLTAHVAQLPLPVALAPAPAPGLDGHAAAYLADHLVRQLHDVEAVNDQGRLRQFGAHGAGEDL